MSIENPAAFPFSSYQPGMTLRDYFAGQALIGLMMKDPWGDPEMHAAYVYNAADAMLAARQSNDMEGEGRDHG